MFHDQYIDKEENSKLQEVIFRWLTTDEIALNSIDADDPEVSSMSHGYFMYKAACMVFVLNAHFIVFVCLLSPYRYLTIISYLIRPRVLRS